MAEWIVERGIGEIRAAMIENGEIVEALVEPDDHARRAGTVADARLIEIGGARRWGVVRFDDGDDALLSPFPLAATQGQILRVEMVRERIAEAGRDKRAKVRASEGAVTEGPDLFTRIMQNAVPVRELRAHDADALEAAGWSELIEEAVTGDVAFPGGALRISLTPAMTLIDVDGDETPETLAVTGAAAAARAIRRMGIAGSIGIDLPSVEGRAARQAAGDAIDVVLPQPFERTAVNGFGFVQIIRPRVRRSLIEWQQDDRAGSAARALIRRAERSGLTGAVTIAAHPRVIAAIAPAWTEALARTLGGPTDLHADPALGMDSGHVFATPR